MMTMIVLLLFVSLLTLLYGSRIQWQRKACPACGSYNPAQATRCAYCTTWFTHRAGRVTWAS